MHEAYCALDLGETCNLSPLATKAHSALESSLLAVVMEWDVIVNLGAICEGVGT